MRTYSSNSYFENQSSALNEVFQHVQSKGYSVNEPDNLWTEHVSYGTTVHYNLPLIKTSTGNPARKWLHIALYRMDSGRYELTHYLN